MYTRDMLYLAFTLVLFLGFAAAPYPEGFAFADSNVAGFYYPSVDFDLTIAGANEVLGDYYNEEKFPTHIDGTYSQAGMFQTNIRIELPSAQNVRIFTDNLYADITWRISASYRIDGISFSFDKLITTRVGLDRNRFDPTKIQILDTSLPSFIRNAMRSILADLLKQLSGLTVNIPLTSCALSSNQLAYDFWLARPFLKTQARGAIYDLFMVTPAYLLLRGDFAANCTSSLSTVGRTLDLGVLQHQLNIDIQPTSLDVEVDITAEDVKAHASVGAEPDVSQVPEFLKFLVKTFIKGLFDQGFTIYKGSLIGKFNEQIPDEVSIRVEDLPDPDENILEDRIRFSQEIKVYSEPPQFYASSVVSAGKVTTCTTANIAAHVARMVVSNVFGQELFSVADPGDLTRANGFEYCSTWDGISQGHSYHGFFVVYFLIDNGYQLFFVGSRGIL